MQLNSIMEDFSNNKPNFERINYSIRPAKHVERKMLCETFHRLSIIDNLKKYRYIGMGSAYFSDFSLFHKSLGITKMLSIEGEVDFKQRIKFNVPFSCIRVVFGFTSDVIPTLPWEKWKERSIVWLDYTETLMQYMLGDINDVVFNVKPGSIFLLSVNIERQEQLKGTKQEQISDQEYRIRYLENTVGKEYIPPRTYELNLNVENNKKIIREIIDNTIIRAVKKRNDNTHYIQLFNFYYKDSADMLTVGGIILDDEKANKIEALTKNLEFIRHGEETFDIIVPKLTNREIHSLDKVLPNKDTIRNGIALNGNKKIPLSTTDVKNYASIYRYFPTFSEINL